MISSARLYTDPFPYLPHSRSPSDTKFTFVQQMWTLIAYMMTGTCRFLGPGVNAPISLLVADAVDGALQLDSGCGDVPAVSQGNRPAAPPAPPYQPLLERARLSSHDAPLTPIRIAFRGRIVTRTVKTSSTRRFCYVSDSDFAPSHNLPFSSSSSAIVAGFMVAVMYIILAIFRLGKLAEVST